MLMAWRDLCRNRQAAQGIFAYDSEEGERYMENKRLQFLPTFEQLMLLGLPAGVEYHNAECLVLGPRDFHPCVRRQSHGRKFVHESIIDRDQMMRGD
eukprot:4216443-Karenia_brevis.AAC.1